MNTSKIQLAKLLATENITVRHSSEAKTASFDVKFRLLTLPNWVTSDLQVLDLMTGHEVGHALWTLMEDWEKALLSPDYQYHKGILNVVEDARIEKKIKRRYPGLVKSFISGYKSLTVREFFHPMTADVSTFNLVDRINLHFKQGPLTGIPFSKEELFYVDKVDSCESWDDVLSACRAIQEYMAENMNDLDSVSEDSGHDGMMGQVPSEDSTHSSMDSDDSDPDGSEDMSNDSGDMEDYGGYGDMVNDDFDSISQELPEDLVSTQESFDQMMDQLVPDSARTDEIRYFSTPTPNLKNIIVSYKDVISEIGAIADRNTRIMTKDKDLPIGLRDSRYQYMVKDTEAEFVKFKRQSMKIVGYMAKEFERKKAAQEYRKESVAKTGVLDMGKIHSYKYNDDLFLRNTIRPDGKNHGVVMLLDWSASMSSHLFDTMKQVLNLVWFCQKVNIPYEVYAFTNSYNRPWDKETTSGISDMGDFILNRHMKQKALGPVWLYKDGNATFGNDNDCSDFNLLNMFSSRMNAKESVQAQKLLFRRCLNDRYERWGAYDLSSTPLLDGLTAMNGVIPNFQERYNLDITNLIVLTDGEGNSRYNSIHGVEGYGSSLKMGRYHDCRMEDPITKKVYKLNDMFSKNLRIFGYGAEVRAEERAVMHQLRDRYGINIIGIFLNGESNRISQRTFEDFLGWRNNNPQAHKDARTALRKDGVVAMPSVGYDEFYIMPVGKLREEASELEIDGDMTVGKMKNAFKKNQSKKFGNKVLVNRMMDIIA